MMHKGMIKENNLQALSYLSKEGIEKVIEMSIKVIDRVVKEFDILEYPKYAERVSVIFYSIYTENVNHDLSELVDGDLSNNGISLDVTYIPEDDSEYVTQTSKLEWEDLNELGRKVTVGIIKQENKDKLQKQLHLRKQFSELKEIKSIISSEINN